MCGVESLPMLGDGNWCCHLLMYSNMLQYKLRSAKLVALAVLNTENISAC